MYDILTAEGPTDERLILREGRSQAKPRSVASCILFNVNPQYISWRSA